MTRKLTYENLAFRRDMECDDDSPMTDEDYEEICRWKREQRLKKLKG